MPLPCCSICNQGGWCECRDKKIASLQAEKAELKTYLDGLKQGIEDRVEFYQVKLEKLESENGRLRDALQRILDYGKALHPSPMNPVTYNACAIAQEALSPAPEKKEGV